MQIKGINTGSVNLPKLPDAVDKPSIDTATQKADKLSQKQEDTVPKSILEEAIKKANEVFQALNTHLQFKVHEATGRYFVQIVNGETNEVIREVPAKKHLDMVAAMEKAMKGIIVDEMK